MQPALRRVLSRFPRVRVLVLGDLVADHYLYGETERISREAPVLIVRHQSDSVSPGGAANVAANARALGAKVTVIGALGRDAMGATLQRHFDAAGITFRGVVSPKIPTETKTRVLAGGRSTTRQQMLRIDRGSLGPLPLPVQRALIRTLEKELPSADVVAVSDYGAGVLDQLTRAVVLDWCRSGGRVCVDSRFQLSDFRGATFAKPNEPELAALVGRPLRSEGEFRSAARDALKQLDCGCLLVTRGQKGMLLLERGGPEHLLPVHGPDDAVDVTGAGDTVTATTALALGAGATPLECARLANFAAAVVVQKPGTAVVTTAELQRA